MGDHKCLGNDRNTATSVSSLRFSILEDRDIDCQSLKSLAFLALELNHVRGRVMLS